MLMRNNNIFKLMLFLALILINTNPVDVNFTVIVFTLVQSHYHMIIRYFLLYLERRVSIQHVKAHVDTVGE